MTIGRKGDEPMAKFTINESGGLEIELNMTALSSIDVHPDVLEEIQEGGGLEFQRLVNDLEWSFQDTLESCFQGNPLEAKQRLQVLQGRLADLQLRWS